MYSRVYCEITNICNGNCSFCPGTSRKKQMISEEEFTVLCEKLQGVTKYIYLHVMGEPLTHPKLPRLIRIGKSMGFNVCITTNGTLLGERGREIVEAGAYKVNISVHSFEGGERDGHLAYIKSCLDFADYASDAGVLTVLRLWNRGCDGGLNEETEKLMHEKFPHEWSVGVRGARIRHRLHLEWGDRFEWPDMDAADGGDSVFCYGLSDHFGVLVDGTVIPCCLDREGAISLGNIYSEDIREILGNPRAVAMREGFKCRHATEELCRKCGYARRF